MPNGSSGNGGRPRNAWLPSRERKLVRLYSLTTLKVVEISQVLVADSFKPSRSDTQKKLQTLLPKDYTKESRGFRPADYANMRLRLETVQIGMHKKSKNRTTGQKKGKKTGKRRTVYQVEGMHTALRDYGQLLATSTDIPMALPFPMTRSLTPPSQLVDTSRVMLDGSSLLCRTSDIEAEGKPATNRDQLVPVTRRHRISSVTSSSASSGCKDSETPSVNSLRRRLADKYSQPYLEHISSVLQCSSPSSIGSSQTPAGRIGSSKSSCGSLQYDRCTSSSSRAWKSVDYQNRHWSDISCGLSKAEKSVWDELVDESKLSAPLMTPLPDYSFMSLVSRKCCISLKDHQVPYICNICGFQPIHRLYSCCPGDLGRFSKLQERREFNISECDYFGNTPLHCAAACGHLNILCGQIEFIGLKCTIFGLNTAGESPIHLIRCSTAEDVEFATKIFNFLELDLSLSFGRSRTCHGLTMLHNILQSTAKELFRPTILQFLFNKTGLDIYAADSQGITLLEILKERASTNPDPLLEGFIRHEEESSPYYRGIPGTACTTVKHSTFYHSYRSVVIDSSYYSNSEFLGSELDAHWIDVDGDTLLTAMIKYWKDDNAELELRVVVHKLLDCESGIDVKDRSGNTPLAAATARGFRAVAELLLDMGANIHTRNYAGDGLLTQAYRWERSARGAGNNKLHIRIWNTFLLLVDRGAKNYPTDIDEWMTQRGKEKFSRRAIFKSEVVETVPISISKCL